MILMEIPPALHWTLIDFKNSDSSGNEKLPAGQFRSWKGWGRWSKGRACKWGCMAI